MTEKKRKSKVGTPRTEVFAMRFDPKLKYLAEIAARRQRRSLANFVEWAIEQALNTTYIVDPNDFNNNGVTIADSSSTLWALDEADRLIKLAFKYPDLLTYDEQLIWRVICDHSAYNKETKRICRFKDNEEGVSMDLVRDCWREIKAYALDSGAMEELNSAMCQHDSIPF